MIELGTEGGSGAHGIATEEDVRAVTATLGLSDFVYQAELVQKGGGNREPGDAILFANNLGAIIQVKSREPEAGAADTPEKVQRWINKHGNNALKQADGTRRNLCQLRDNGNPPLALPLRAAHLPEAERRAAGLLLNMDNIEIWPTIIVLDHPNIGEANSPVSNDAFCITLQDWTELLRVTRSITGLLSYVTRVIESNGAPNTVLGNERERFAEFVAADRAASEDGVGFLDWSTAEETDSVDFYRQLLERVWPADGELPVVPINEYRQILEHLDGVPPGSAAQIGAWMSAKQAASAENARWQGGLIIADDRLTVFAVDQLHNYRVAEDFTREFLALVTLRARQITDQTGKPLVAGAIGVLMDASHVDYVFALLSGPFDLPSELVAELETRHGVYDVKTQIMRAK